MNNRIKLIYKFLNNLMYSTIIFTIFPSDVSASSALVKQKVAYTHRLIDSTFWNRWGPSSLAFAGVVVTLIGKWFFDYMRQKREIKRDLYLKVADAMFESGQLLGSFSNTQIQPQQIMFNFGQCLSPISKTDIVAGNNLLNALSDFKDVLGIAVFTLVRERAQLEPILIRVRAREPFIQQVSDRIDANLAEQNRIAVEIDGNARESLERFHRLQQIFKSFMEEREGYIQQQKADTKLVNEICIGINNIVMEHLKKFSPVRVRVLALMRKELKFRFDVAAYERRQIIMAEKAFNELEKTHETIRDLETKQNGH